MTQRDVVCWNALLLGYVENGESLVALDMFNCMDCAPNRVTFVAAVKACARLATDEKLDKKTCLHKGEEIHRRVKERGFDRDAFVVNTLVDMYSKCGSMLHARKVFDGMTHRDVVTWNALILGYVENGQSSMALEMFNSIKCAPNRVTYIAAMKACASLARESDLEKKKAYLQHGLNIHRRARQCGFDRDVFVENTLVDMYSKCGSMLDAQEVFDTTMNRDVVSWSSLILGYVENGESSVALDVFSRMDCPPNRVAFIAALKACVSNTELDKETCLQKVMAIHRQVRESGFERDVPVANTLVNMYSKCGSMQHARDVFDRMVRKDVVSWTVLLLGYVENGKASVALDVFNIMDCTPNCVTFVGALKACIGLASNDKKACLQKGVAVHRQARECGLDKDVFVANTLVDMYSNCGSMQQAQEVFDKMLHRDVISWNVLILGYVENGQSLLALDMFNMIDCIPDNVTFVGTLKALAVLATENKMDKHSCLQKDVDIHNQVRELGFEKDAFVATTLVDMYSKCGNMILAKDVFDRMRQPDVVSWNTLILGYVENGESLAALEVLNCSECAPNNVTYVGALKACAGLAIEKRFHKEACLQKGMSVHKQARERGYDTDMYVSNALVDMYSKCGDMSQARDVFEKMINRDVVSWNALILGYVENGESSMALDVFNNMECVPDNITFMAALKACGSLGGLESGHRIHERARELGLEEDEMIASSLVDFYGKCGDISAAEGVFNRMHSPDVVSWTALIGGYASLGDTAGVIKSVKKMEESGLRMDNVTMLLVLTACGHAGMVEEGQKYFDSMSKYGLSPSLEHYTCMVDMLGRANRLEEALSLVNRMPFKANSQVWMAVLSACSKWGNVEIGRVAFEALAQEDLTAAYVLMRNIYERLGMFEESEYIEAQRRRRV